MTKDPDQSAGLGKGSVKKQQWRLEEPAELIQEERDGREDGVSRTLRWKAGWCVQKAICSEYNEDQKERDQVREFSRKTPFRTLTGPWFCPEQHK